MTRRMILAATFFAAIAIPALPAAAGGGCHGDATTGAGDTVEMRDRCFGPTTLQIDPGDTVTFVNRDHMTHNVTAAGWGFYEDMGFGDRFIAMFDAEGIYPFACTYHPGMTGAIVVGKGIAAGAGENVTAQAPATGEGSSPEAIASTTSAGLPVGLGVVFGAAGLVLGLGAGLFVRRGRPPSA